jgi:hypothetical protein
MSLVFTPLATDNFTPNAGSLNPAHWTTFTDAAIYGACRPHSASLESTTATYNAGLIGGAVYTGISFPANQYITFTLTPWAIGSTNEVDWFLRMPDNSGDYGYSGDIIDNGDGITAEIDLGYYDNTQNFITLWTNQSAIVAQGDVFTTAVVGSTLFLYQNGVLISGAVNDPLNYYPLAGPVGLDTNPQDSATETGAASFIAGSAALVPSPGGPATNGAIFPGPYGGSSLATAFPHNTLDIFQVVDEGGNIVWNLNYLGVATAEPANPTNGTVLGQFSGSSFAQAFAYNPDQLNVFQLIGQGGEVVFHVDYQGNAATP